eukprot:TRINITY_DN27782_c0_g1_i1.p1 TRINITY_DN27782_c0_g1~~TRINITY_DN27782_c0_g1_i1.p1  ORF type:complete len:205 (-),score=36.06 TRINITY_DN27782_c0_g1_i1:84-698(-)
MFSILLAGRFNVALTCVSLALARANIHVGSRWTEASRTERCHHERLADLPRREDQTVASAEQNLEEAPSSEDRFDEDEAEAALQQKRPGLLERRRLHGTSEVALEPSCQEGLPSEPSSTVLPEDSELQQEVDDVAPDDADPDAASASRKARCRQTSGQQLLHAIFGRTNFAMFAFGAVMEAIRWSCQSAEHSGRPTTMIILMAI